jgi:hypothetical protein
LYEEERLSFLDSIQEAKTFIKITSTPKLAYIIELLKLFIVKFVKVELSQSKEPPNMQNKPELEGIVKLEKEQE